MAAPTIPAVPEDFSFVNWQEMVAGSQPGGAQVFSETQQSAALVVHLQKPNQKNSFLRKVRGYSYADVGSPYRLYRINPMQHPEDGLRYLRATQVAFEDYHPAGNPANSADNYKPYRFVEDANIEVESWTYYGATRATVQFASVPYPIIHDDDYGESWYIYEYDRNVDWFAETTADISVLTAQTDKALKIIEGPANHTPIPADIGEYLPKLKLAWKWYNVPHEYIYGWSGNTPSKLLSGLGKVNSDTFRDYPKMTLLLEAFQLERFLNPWQWENYLPSFSYNITFCLSHFDPLPAVASPVFRGHNLLPWSQAGTSNGSIWFSASRPANGGLANPYLPHYDFGELFSHADAPPSTLPAYPSYPP